MGYSFEPLSYGVWGACIEVQRQLGPHCMEVDYQRALELGSVKVHLPATVTPAEAGVQRLCLDSRFRGNDTAELILLRALSRAKGGLEFIREAEIPITFDGIEITRRRVDFVIWDNEATLILEVKAAKAVKPEDHEQCLLYLCNGNCRVCLLANFGEVPLGKMRKVHTSVAPALYGPHP